jgi:hypothetical protein
MNSSEINDIRGPSEFKGISFSNFKKCDVKNQFIENMLKGKIEPSCYWGAELVCAGHYLELWENILYYCSKHIHIGNPKLVCYLEKRFNVFKQIITDGQYLSELTLRNNSIIRNLFAEVICILTTSSKKHSFEVIKINRIEEFDITQMTERLKAPNMNFITPIFKSDDPKEIFIPMNEFAYNISQSKRNTVFACYWIEWLLEFDAMCRKKKEPCYCSRRDFVTVENKLSRDIVWLIWDTIFHYIKERANPFLERTMSSLFTLFSLHYTNACGKKRRYMLYFAVSLCTENIDSTVEIISDKRIVELAINNIGEIYSQIKKNEISPNTEYLFAGLEKQTSFAKSMERMNMVNSVSMGTYNPHAGKETGYNPNIDDTT